MDFNQVKIESNVRSNLLLFSSMRFYKTIKKSFQLGSVWLCRLWILEPKAILLLSGKTVEIALESLIAKNISAALKQRIKFQLEFVLAELNILNLGFRQDTFD